ncbi:MAG: energy transducer TonB [Crocinitomicaceae bacterium]|jgi:TonB family protein|nr:energy transducer TonB [Crocinitomicaceae bacterium]
MKNLFILSILTLLFTASAFAQLQEDVDYNPSVQPEFFGGQEAMNAYLKENLNYPADALENKKTETIFVEFVINEDGSISRQIARRGGHPSLVTEALRVVSEMPAWNPGQDASGKNVKTSITLPVRFEL